MNLLEIGWGGVNWIALAQNRDKWRALVNAVMNIQVPLTHICNAILGTGIFPDRLKFAIVKPCFKKRIYRKFPIIGLYHC
jgi:hypothetical protein